YLPLLHSSLRSSHRCLPSLLMSSSFLLLLLFFFLSSRLLLSLPSFPTRRSSDLVFPTFFFIASKNFLPLHVKHRLKIGLFYPQYQEGNESIVKIHSLFLHEQDPLHVPIGCESMIDLPLPDCLKLESEYAVHWNFRSSPLFQVHLQHLPYLLLQQLHSLVSNVR